MLASKRAAARRLRDRELRDPERRIAQALHGAGEIERRIDGDSGPDELCLRGSGIARSSR